jgi:hypothetical protein
MLEFVSPRVTVSPSEDGFTEGAEDLGPCAYCRTFEATVRGRNGLAYCETHAMLGLLKAPEPPPAEAPAPGSQGGAANDEAVSALLAWAAANGWPRLPIGPGVAVGTGETAWRTFLRRANPDLVLRATLAACQDRERR